MAARRLVLNGLTAEVAGSGGGGAGGGGSAPASPEFYHELELYRVLLALPEPRARTPDPPARAARPRRRARTPDARAPPTPPPQTRPARYLGSFGAGGAADARADTVSRRLHCMKEGGCAVPVLLVVSLAGVKVCDPQDQSVRMSHALRRISYATCERARALFAFVAREPRAEPRAEPLGKPPTEPCAEPLAEPNQQYCHAFETDTPEQAEELNALVGDAFRMAFASQLQPSAPLWSKELNGGSCSRIPDSLPGLTRHYPHLIDRSPTRCDIMGGSKREASEPEASEASPSSSEEWNSPTELSCYRRLGERADRGERGERAPLMRRLALGLSGALLQPSDDDSTPLVTDTPTTPTNAPLCLPGAAGGAGGAGGYINEASEGARFDRERRRLAAEHDFDFTNISNGRPSAGSTAASTSSGSSCASGNNNNSSNNGNNSCRPPEPELRHAPWFQQGIPREIALEVLAAQAPGAFLVRGSTTQAGCLALSLRVPRDFAPHGLAHYLILRTAKGYKIKGFTKEFSSLSALVTHHSVMPELLPVPLRLPRAPQRHRSDMEALERLAPPPAAPPPRLAYRAPLDV